MQRVEQKTAIRIGRLLFATAIIVMILAAAGTVRAQCGVPGTPPCPPENKPVGANPGAKKKITPSYADFQKKILGKWKSFDHEREHHWTFRDNRAGWLEIEGEFCGAFSYSLKGNLLTITYPKNSPCSDAVEKYLISFNQKSNAMTGYPPEDKNFKTFWTRIK